MCELYRIPHSHFLGGPLVWSVLDREKALAYQGWKARHCPGCGTREEEWDPERGGDRFAYVAETYRCPGCELRAMEQENIPDGAKGVKIALVPNIDLDDDDDDEAGDVA